MLSVAKLSPGQEAYYERSVAAGIEDYYAGEGESPGVWVGAGARALELDGVVEEGELGRLIGGKDPRTGVVLRRHPPRKLISLERIDPLTGERSVEQKTLAPVAGFDLVFSPPKSVSLLHALGDERVRQVVTQAHLSAWQAALGYLEQEACATRRGKNGVLREHGVGFVGAAYQHRTSRAQDPHLHTHVIVANLTRGADGKWRALDGEPLLKGYRLAAGYLYQAQLRFELTSALGLEWREPIEGMAELPGIPVSVLRTFSQRRERILDHLERCGESGFYAAKRAALETRARKQPVDLPRLRDEWRARAAEHGLGRRELDGLVGRAVVRQLDAHDLDAISDRLAGAQGLTEKQTTFTAADAVTAWAQVHRQGAPSEQVLLLAEQFLSAQSVVQLRPGTPGRPAVLSSVSLIEDERAALALAERQADAPTMPASALEAVTRRYRGLSEEQLQLVCAAASSPERVVCVVGAAGSGKTTALAALAEGFRCEGLEVLGAAPSGIAATKLAAETGCASGTLHRLLLEIKRRGGLPAGCVLIVDEAGMADTRTLTRVLFAVERAGGKAVLVGDPGQLPAVGAGGLFAALVARHGAIELNLNQRQRDPSERDALALLRDGESYEYLADAARRGNLIVAGSPIEAKARLVADWWRAAQSDLAGAAMIALRRADVAELNAAARAILDAEERLGRKRFRLPDGTELALGDRILCGRNDPRLGVSNGTRGTIVALDRSRRTIELAVDAGQRVLLPCAYLEAGEVRHAYAITGHKAQGLTFERTFVLAGGHGNQKEWGYVTLSRARLETRLYTTAGSREPGEPPHRPDPRRPLERFAEALASSAAEPLAIHAGHARVPLTNRELAALRVPGGRRRQRPLEPITARNEPPGYPPKPRDREPHLENRHHEAPSPARLRLPRSRQGIELEL